MTKYNLIQDKSFQFSLRIIELYKHLTSELREYVISKQLLRSGTSIGANIEESIGSQSKNDFFAKITISYKESRETFYWLKLLKASNYLDDKLADSLLDDCEQIIKIITKIQKTLKSRSSNS